MSRPFRVDEMRRWLAPTPPRGKREIERTAPISFVKPCKSERALRAFGLSKTFWNSAVCLMVLMKSSGTSVASRLGVAEKVRYA